jgi:glycerol-3-phosphate dehydrogenase
LDDFILRRSMLAMLGHLTPEMLDEIAGMIANALGWTKEQRKAEVERTFSILADRHGVVLNEDEGLKWVVE